MLPVQTENEDASTHITKTIIPLKKMDSGCSPTECKGDDSKEKLKCESCGRAIHYSCTQLPLYQIGLFLTKNYEKYKCIGCVKLPRRLSKLSKTLQAEKDENTPD